MKFYILIGIILLLIIGSASLYIALNSKPDKLSAKQREEAVGEIMGRKANLNPEIKTGSGNFESKYISFSYPSAAVEYKYKNSDSRNSKVKDIYSYDIKSPRIVFNYIASQASGKIEDNSAVKFRLIPSSGYKSEEIKADGISGILFSKESEGEYPSEASAFFLTNGIIYSLSVTSSSLEDAKKLMSSTISSINFK